MSETTVAAGRVSGTGSEPPGADAIMEGKSASPGPALRENVASGVRWGFITAIVTQFGRFAFIVVLMRLLGPENYGIISQAAIFIAIAQLFVHFGMAASIIQSPSLNEKEAGTAFWMNIGLGLAITVTLIASAPLIASLFNTEALTSVIRLLTISIIIKSITIVPIALLTRKMRFRALGIAEIVSTLISGALGVAAALWGAGYWALVIQAICLEACTLIIIFMISGFPELGWSTSTARRLWSFSSRLMGADLVNYASTNSDKFLVGWSLGPVALGLYSLAFRVLQFVLQICGQIGRVILPTFCRLQDDRERLTRVFLEVTESVAIAVCPLMVLIIMCAPIGVPAVFGEAWVGAVVPFQLLAAMTVPYVLVAFMGPLTVAVGRPDLEFLWGVATAVMSLIAFAIGLLWGIVGVAASYLIISSIQLPIRLVIIERLIPIRARDYVKAMLPSAVCSLVLAIGWLIAEVLLEGILSGLVLLIAASAFASAAYAIALWIVWPDVIHRQLNFFQLVLRRKQA